MADAEKKRLQSELLRSSSMVCTRELWDSWNNGGGGGGGGLLCCAPEGGGGGGGTRISDITVKIALKQDGN